MCECLNGAIWGGANWKGWPVDEGEAFLLWRPERVQEAQPMASVPLVPVVPGTEPTQQPKRRLTVFHLLLNTDTGHNKPGAQPLVLGILTGGKFGLHSDPGHRAAWQEEECLTLAEQAAATVHPAFPHSFVEWLALRFASPAEPSKGSRGLRGRPETGAGQVLGGPQGGLGAVRGCPSVGCRAELGVGRCSKGLTLDDPGPSIRA